LKHSDQYMVDRIFGKPSDNGKHVVWNFKAAKAESLLPCFFGKPSDNGKHVVWNFKAAKAESLLPYSDERSKSPAHVCGAPPLSSNDRLRIGNS